jgi:tRNA(fMet)-specific endonuclease VapC
VSYLLDTSAVSDYFKRVGKTYERLQAQPPYLLAISTITEHEMRFGVALRPSASRFGTAVRSFLQLVERLPFSREDAAAAAHLRAELSRSGRPIGDFDVLVAGVALARDLTLVTSNERELGRVPGLLVENWRR